MVSASRAPTLLTREQAADYLGIRPQTLAVWHATGRYALPVVKVGRCVRYRQSDLEKFLESRTERHGAELASAGV